MNEENGQASFYRDTIEDLEVEKYQLEDPMTFWNAEKKTFWKKILRRTEAPFVLMGIALVLVIVVFFAIYPGGEAQDTFSDSDALSDRFQQIEARMGSMEKALQGLSELRQDMGPVKTAVLRFDSADASMSARLETLTGQLASLRKEMDALKHTLSAEAKGTDASPRTEKSEAVSQPAYHEVRKGDTLYGIARQYGVSVEKLREFNGLSEKDAIYPGQKLNVRQ